MRPRPSPLSRRRRWIGALALVAGTLACLPADAATPGGAAPQVVAVLGDGFAEALTEGLQLDLADQPGMSVVAATHAPSGLADPGYDWGAAATALLARQHVDRAVVMLGAGDRAPLPDGAAAAAAPLGLRWRVLYGDRVQALAEVFRTARVPLVWVGLPIVADETAAADYVVFNEIARDRAALAGAAYVDTWNAFADEGGRYSAMGPDAKGRTVRLRLRDGYDLTRAGAVKLASFVEPALRAPAADAAPPTLDAMLPGEADLDRPLDNDITAQIRREAGLAALPGSGAGKAERGPVVALTAPPLAGDGHLAAPVNEPAPLAGTGGTLAQRALVQGLPIPPRTGRVDDFAWPRP